LAAILLAVTAELYLCAPDLSLAASHALAAILIGLGIVAAVALAAYWAFCDKPCWWGLLFAWQITLGAGLVTLLLTKCCTHLQPVGWAAVLAGVAGAVVWARKCKVSVCTVLRKFAPVIASVLSLVFGALGGIPVLTACVDSAFQIVMGILSAGEILALAGCSGKK